MEVKSNSIKKEGNDWREGEGIVKKQNITMGMEVKSNGIKKKGDDQHDDEGIVKKQNVTMVMEVFDCPVCSTPLRPPIFQVNELHSCTYECQNQQNCFGVLII